MIFACLSMIVAGGIEIYREWNCHTGNNHAHRLIKRMFSISEGQASSASIYYTIVQNILLGFSQIFALISSLQYAYFASPRSAQALFMSLHFCSIGISSFIGAGYVAIFSLIASNSHSSSKITFLFQCLSTSGFYWPFYSYFFILAGLQLLFIFIFVYCQKKFDLIKLNPQQKEIKQAVQY